MKPTLKRQLIVAIIGLLIGVIFLYSFYQISGNAELSNQSPKIRIWRFINITSGLSMILSYLIVAIIQKKYFTPKKNQNQKHSHIITIIGGILIGCGLLIFILFFFILSYLTIFLSYEEFINLFSQFPILIPILYGGLFIAFILMLFGLIIAIISGLIFEREVDKAV